MYGLDGTDRLFAGVGSNFVIGADVVNKDAVAEVFYDQTTDKMQMRVKAKSGVILYIYLEISFDGFKTIG